MYVQELRLLDYRNITDQTLTFDPGVNVISGLNAQGKTNIIEALWLFSAFKSFRTAADRDFINHERGAAGLQARFVRHGRKYTAKLKYYRDRRREIYINDIKMKPGEAVGKFLSVLFFPEHLNLVKSGPEQRRRFLDFALCQLRPGYLDALNRYNRILYQRNSLLKSPERAVGYDIGVWDEKLAAAGAEVYLQRLKYTERLLSHAAQTALQISEGAEQLGLVYRSCCSGAADRQEAERMLYESVRAAYARDTACGFSTVGVHKDDLEICINGRPARAFGSQGQQRSAVLALKLAETEIIKEEYGEYPVLLFDDVFSELDSRRREYITGRIMGKQVIITACEDGGFESAAKVFRVEAGQAREV